MLTLASLTRLSVCSEVFIGKRKLGGFWVLSDGNGKACKKIGNVFKLLVPRLWARQVLRLSKIFQDN